MMHQFLFYLIIVRFIATGYNEQLTKFKFEFTNHNDHNLYNFNTVIINQLISIQHRCIQNTVVVDVLYLFTTSTIDFNDFILFLLLSFYDTMIHSMQRHADVDDDDVETTG